MHNACTLVSVFRYKFAKYARILFSLRKELNCKEGSVKKNHRHGGFHPYDTTKYSKNDQQI